VSDERWVATALTDIFCDEVASSGMLSDTVPVERYNYQDAYTVGAEKSLQAWEPGNTA
jgi:hypothetical protein